MIESLGNPDFSFAGLKIWIRERQFPDKDDYWDGNWLIVTACCKSEWSQACSKGPIIHLSDFQQWLQELENLNRTCQGEADLSCIEPNLDLKVSLNKLGSGHLQVQISHDHLAENHEYRFPVDQSYLPGIIDKLKVILKKYPIRGKGI